jgi:molybdopterin converting factor small subunit
MKITIHASLGLKQALGQKITEVELPDESILEDLFLHMKQRWGDKLHIHLFDPDSGQVLHHLRILINGRTVHLLRGMKTKLNEGDEVVILPLISGG